MTIEQHNHNGIQISPSASQWNIDSDDEDEPLTEEDLEAIDAAFQSASKRPRLHHDGALRRRRRRRLPNSIVALQHPDSFTRSPCHEKAKMRYPVLKFLGKITYSRTAVEVERAASELLERVEAKRRKVGQVAIGFDMEWKATFRKGASPGTVAVLQICVDPSNCHVMHIIHSGIPTSLQSLLENSMLWKVGVGIGNDALKLFKDYNVSVEAVKELSYLAKQKVAGFSQKCSLTFLAESIVSKQLVKRKEIRLGNWEARLLSKEQLEYAATDAFASWYLYEALRTLPDLEKVAVESQKEVKHVTLQLE